MQFGVNKHSKFFEDKIARARKANASYNTIYTPNCNKIMFLLVNKVHEKTARKVKNDETFKT